MTQAKNSQALEYLDSLPEDTPSVILKYSPPVAMPGTEVRVSLDIARKFPSQKSFQVILLSNRGEEVSSVSVVTPNLSANLAIPDSAEENTYTLRVFYGGHPLDSTYLEVTKNENYADQRRELAKALEKEFAAFQAVAQRNYQQGIDLLEEASKYYANAKESHLAARAWEEIAFNLFECKEFILAEKACDEYKQHISENLKDVDDKQEQNLEKRINDFIYQCRKAQMKTYKFSELIALYTNKQDSGRRKLYARTDIAPEKIQELENGKGSEQLEKYWKLFNYLDLDVNTIIDKCDDDAPRKLGEEIKKRGKSKDYSLIRLIADEQFLSSEISEWQEGKGFSDLNLYCELYRYITEYFINNKKLVVTNHNSIQSIIQ